MAEWFPSFPHFLVDGIAFKILERLAVWIVVTAELNIFLKWVVNLFVVRREGISIWYGSVLL